LSFIRFYGLFLGFYWCGLKLLTFKHMRGFEKGLVLLLLVVGLDVYSQGTQSGLLDLWEVMSAQDDYEKNYRFPDFVDALKEVEGFEEVDSLSHYLPSGWSHAIVADSSIIVMAGILPYEVEPDRLIWLVQQRGDVSELSVFTTQLAASSVVSAQPNVQLASYELTDIPFVSVTISVGTTQVFDLPDIYTQLVLQDLIESVADDKKLLLSQELWTRMEQLLGHEPLFKHNFTGYEQVSTLQSPDGLVKVLTWNLEFANGTNTFRGAVAVNLDGKVVVHELKDSYQSIKNPEQASLSTTKWFGAVYYEILQHSYRRNTYYTLLGFNPNNPFSKIRVVEVMSLAANGTPRFGHAILEVEGRSKRRMILEYSNRVSMMLRYDAGERMIVMDNLVPSAPMFQNDFRYYGPDFTHNGLRFEKGKWVYVDNIELRNTRVR